VGSFHRKENKERDLIPWETYESGEDPVDICGLLSMEKVSVTTDHEPLFH
jgi:hypothetical protein